MVPSKAPPRVVAPRGRVNGNLPAPTPGIGIPDVGARNKKSNVMLSTFWCQCMTSLFVRFFCYPRIGAHAVLFSKFDKKCHKVCLFAIRGLVLTPSLFFTSFNFWKIGDHAASPVDFGTAPSRCSFLYSPLRQTFLRGPPVVGNQNFEITKSPFLQERLATTPSSPWTLAQPFTSIHFP